MERTEVKPVARNPKSPRLHLFLISRYFQNISTIFPQNFLNISTQYFLQFKVGELKENATENKLRDKGGILRKTHKKVQSHPMQGKFYRC